MDRATEGTLLISKWPLASFQAPLTTLSRPPRQASSGPWPPFASPDLWGPRGGEKNLGPLPLPAWPLCTFEMEISHQHQARDMVSSFVSLLVDTCPPLAWQGRGAAGSGLHPRPPTPWPVSLGAVSQSRLLPMSKTHSFPSENTNGFLASQRAAQVKWAMVSE